MCRHDPEGQSIRQLRQSYIKLLCLKAILQGDSHASTCSVHLVRYPTGVAWYFYRCRFHVTVGPRFCHSDDVGMVPENKIVEEVTDVSSELSYVS